MVKNSFKTAFAVLLITSAITPLTFGQAAHASYTESEMRAMLEEQAKFEVEQKQAAEAQKVKDREERVTIAREKMEILVKAADLAEMYNNHMAGFIAAQSDAAASILSGRYDSMSVDEATFHVESIKYLSGLMEGMKSTLPDGYEFPVNVTSMRAIDNFLFVASRRSDIQKVDDKNREIVKNFVASARKAEELGLDGADELLKEALSLQAEFNAYSSEIDFFLMRAITAKTFDLPLDIAGIEAQHASLNDKIQTAYNTAILGILNPENLIADGTTKDNTAGGNSDKDPQQNGANNDATDNVDRNVIIPPSISLNTGTKAYTLKIDGRDMAIFVNYDTGNVVGYGYTGIGGASLPPVTASGMDYAQGVFVGKLNADGTQIIGEFLGITGATMFDNDFFTVSFPNLDTAAMRIINLPRSVLQNGGTGTVEGHILTGPANGFDRTLSYISTLGTSDPYKVGNGSTKETSSNTPVTYEGYGRILSQNRSDNTVGTPVVMDDLGDLKVTVDTTKGSEDVTFNFNGTNPQPTAIKAVVNDRIAAAVGQLANNVMRTGVMFPLENYEYTNLVHFTDFVNGMNNSSDDDIGYGFGIVGKPTPLADMPSGTATYNGGAAGYVTETYQGAPTDIARMEQFYGNTTLNVDFGTNAVTGSINTFRQLDNTSIASFTVNGGVSGNGLSFSMSDQNGPAGAGNGSFFGAGAKEVGGQFSTSVTGDYFGAATDVQHDGVFWGARP